MLTLLRIENFILIDHAEIEFDKGLSVMTGETGAGKSVIMGALNFALGAKATKDMIRKGSDKAVIQAVFQLTEQQSRAFETAYDVPFDDQNLIITRSMNASGRTSNRINGMVIPLNVLQDIGLEMVDMHGQHEHQSLLDTKKHMYLLDLYGGTVIEDKLIEVNGYVDRIRKMDQEMQEIAADELEANRKLERLKFELDELEKANLQVDEDDTLEAQFKTLKNIENVKLNLSKVNHLMNHDDFDALSILRGMRECLRQLGEYEDINADIKDFYQLMDKYFYELEDLNDRIERYQDTVYFDEEQFVEIETRLNYINTLKRKYGHTIEAILTYQETIQLEHQQLKQALDLFDKYQTQRSKELNGYLKASKELTSLRKEAAHRFEHELKTELIDLNFENAVIKVQFNEKDHHSISMNGLDQVEYLISLNKGEEPKPLKRIASGGEISRIMLAIKIIFARIDAIPLLVFDEIDTGISGRTAGVVGEKIAYISNYHQVLCISHLPQIAVMADQHYLIEKASDDDITTTFVRLLNAVDRVDEMSRLTSGKDVTEMTRDHAKEMIAIANKKKESLHKLSN